MFKHLAAAALIAGMTPALAQYEYRIATVYTAGARVALGDSASCTFNCVQSAIYTNARIADVIAAIARSNIPGITITNAGAYHLPSGGSSNVFDTTSPVNSASRGWQGGVGDMRDASYADIVIVIKHGNATASRGSGYGCNTTWDCAISVIDTDDLSKKAYETAAGRAAGAGMPEDTSNVNSNAPYWARTNQACPQGVGGGTGASCAPVAQCFYTLGGKPPADGVAQPCDHALKLVGTNPLKTTCDPQEFCDRHAIYTGPGTHNFVTFTSPFYGVVTRTTQGPQCNPVGWTVNWNPPPQGFHSVYGDSFPIYDPAYDLGAQTIPDDGRCTGVTWQVAPQWSTTNYTPSTGNGMYQGHNTGTSGRNAGAWMESRRPVVASAAPNPGTGCAPHPGNCDIPRGQQANPLQNATHWVVPGITVR